jgi:hypothetical protein
LREAGRETSPAVRALFLNLLTVGHTQEALTIQAEDISIEKARDQGFHLFIRKKPGISSVLLLAESTKDYTGQADTYTYGALEWNEINGDELRIISGSPRQNQEWLLMDSSTEVHPRLGEAFHIYIPPVITYGYPNSRHDTFPVADGIFINIRAFALPYIDYAGPSKDNPFTLSIEALDMAVIQPAPLSPAKPAIHLMPLDVPYPPPEPEPPPVDPRILEEILNRLDRLQAPPPPPPPPAPAPEPKAEGPVFAPIIHAQGGVAIFYPRHEGKTAGLKNTYDPIGTLTLTNQFTQTWGFHLGFDRDPMLMNRIFARATWDIGSIGLEVGPYLGLFNSSTGQVSPGFSVVLHVRIPRWRIFSAFQHDTTLGREHLIGPGDYIQSYSAIKAGAVLPFGRLTLSLIYRNSTIQDDLGMDVLNQWIRYNLGLEISRPPNPWGLRIDLGYQRLQWTYHIGLQPLDYGYGDVYAGLELSYRIGYLRLFLGLETPLYPWVYPQIQSIEDPQAPFFGQIILGFRLSFPLRSGSR